MTHNFWLSFLGLNVLGKDQAAYQGWFPPALARGKIRKTGSILRSAFVSSAAAACEAVTERAPGFTPAALVSSW